jgi:citrate lyase beta subunit
VSKAVAAGADAVILDLEDADAALVTAMAEAAAAGRGAVVFDGNTIDEAMAATARRRLARYRG